MSFDPGHIEPEWAVYSIRVGRRHRIELGDIDELAASIQRDGLLQPITITPDGVLVCGARRLAAIKRLGWKKVNVWASPWPARRPARTGPGRAGRQPAPQAADQA